MSSESSTARSSRRPLATGVRSIARTDARAVVTCHADNVRERPFGGDDYGGVRSMLNELLVKLCLDNVIIR